MTVHELAKRLGEARQDAVVLVDIAPGSQQEHLRPVNVREYRAGFIVLEIAGPTVNRCPQCQQLVPAQR